MKKLMSANWKMYKTLSQAVETATDLVRTVGEPAADREVLVFPPFTAISGVVQAFAGTPGFSVGGQDVYPAEEGAFTGEISPAMLKDTGCTWVLAGHSERRHVLGESSEFVGRKAAFAFASGLKVCLCIGETLEDRKAGKLEDVLEEQLQTGLSGIPDHVSADDITIAYEPVWAIGTGEVAGPDDIASAHNFVRGKILDIFPKNGNNIRILYGGSVKPENAAEIISLDNVGGVLVGGASLQAESFSRIVTA